jgi:transposase InsO family protein
LFDPAMWWYNGPPCWEASAMGQVLHGSARTTEAVRRAIQLRQESVRALARRFGVSPTTVQKWRKRSTTADAKMGPKVARSTVLTPEEEAIVAAFRRHTLLPLDDCLYALQPTIPHLTRSALHRCLQRHGISRLPEVDGDRPGKKRFASYPIGYFQIDIAEVSTEEGKLRLFVAIDRTSKSAFARLVESAGKMEAARFLRELVEAVPYRIHTVLTDNGVQFTPRKQDVRDGRHIFDRVCEEHGIEHRLTKVNHPWTNGQVERMNRTLKDATVKRYHYGSHDQLRAHLRLFVDAYNHARRLKTLRGLTPYEFIHQAWTREPERFRLDPSHHFPGPYS